LIEIKNIVKDFGRVRALNRLTVTVKRGEFFGFLGPNGAGKTTTIKIMTGLLKPTAGSVRIGHFDLKTDLVNAKKITAYIPDKPFLYEKLTGREFLRFIAGLYGADGKRVSEKEAELMELFDMADWIDDLIEGYSHGMRQKMVMSSALIHDPEVIVVDEPMVGLDPKSIKLVKRIFTDLVQQRGVTIFMSTHTLIHAQEMCSRIGIIDRGKLIAVGTIDQLVKKAHAKQRELEEVFFRLTEEEQEEGR
jgi:ABC-2 type transport system ATP-binding protein